MRMMKKVMTGMSLAAAALVVAGGVNAADADAAVKATVDAKQQTMTVSGAANEVWVSYDAVKADKNGTITAFNTAKAKWDVYDGAKATIDLSALKFTKAVFVTIKDTSGDLPVVYRFDADASKLTGKYGVVAATKTSTINFTDEKKAPIDLKGDEAPALEYRTANSNVWTAYEDGTTFAKTAMNMYEKQGATLYFRYAGSEDGITFNTATANDPDEEKATYKLATQKAGRFASAEVKVKIGKEANAPSASIDYDKGAFKVKAAAVEIRNIVDGSYNYDGITAVESPKSGSFVAPVGDIVPIDATQDGIFELRTLASDKKIASKVGVYAYKGTPNLVANKLGLTATAAKDAKKDDVHVTFKNTDNVSYLVYNTDPSVLDSKGKAPKPIATLKAANDKGYKDVVAKKVTTVGTEVQLYVVSASDKKNGVFRSNPLTWEKIMVEAATPTPTPAPEA